MSKESQYANRCVCGGHFVWLSLHVLHCKLVDRTRRAQARVLVGKGER